MTTLTRREASQAAPGWRLVLGRLRLRVPTGDFATGLALVDAIGALAEAAGHHPDVELRYGLVQLALSSHDAGGVTDRDIALATQVSALVEARGLHPDHGAVSVVEVAIDALDISAVRPFWAAVLGWPARTSDVVDPAGRGPDVWFQQMDAPRPQRNRIHIDVSVAHDEAERRVAAALAAGGRLLSDAHAPAFWVLADAEGNEACISTWQGRD